MESWESDLAEARAGSTDAFERLVRGLDSGLRVFVAAHAVDREQVEEVCQETWVTAWRKLPTWRPEAPFDHWLRGIAWILLRRDFATRGRQRRLGGHAMLEDALVGDASEAPGGDDPRLHRLAECMEGLSPRARTMWLARDRDGVPLADLARRFKQPMGAIATMLWRVRASLRTCLEGGAR